MDRRETNKKKQETKQRGSYVGSIGAPFLAGARQGMRNGMTPRKTIQPMVSSKGIPFRFIPNAWFRFSTSKFKITQNHEQGLGEFY